MQANFFLLGFEIDFFEFPVELELVNPVFLILREVELHEPHPEFLEGAFLLVSFPVGTILHAVFHFLLVHLHLVVALFTVLLAVFPLGKDRRAGKNGDNKNKTRY